MAEIIVALDVASAAEARRLVDRMPGIRWVKVGPMLFLDGGPQVIRDLKALMSRIFLDLKWHDIPHAVSGAVRAAADLGVDLATVHALGGSEMLAAAASAASGSDLKLVGVSVLTSHTAGGYFAAVGRNGSGDLATEVARLSKSAVEAGLAGVVASPHEVGVVKAIVGPDRWIVVPGIRPPGSEAGDQRRTADPATAAKAGATHLVVGRPVTQAANPGAVYQELCNSVR